MNKNFFFAIFFSLNLLGNLIYGQNNIVINTGQLDGIEINKQNILSYQIISNLNYSLNSDVTGTLFYRGNDLRINYTFTLRINPGINLIDINAIQIQWTYSSAGLRELFQDYNKLPAGTYQYCIKVTPKNVAGEHDLGNVTEECIYNKNEEMFLINLVDPEDDAKLYEKNPSLSWIANYSFSSDLTYKLRIAEIKKGQNTVTAISRNNPIYSENNLMQNTLVYPMSAKELVINQPYAWTVDAFYKGILLGGAEPWKFTIIEDTLLEPIPKEVSYLDIVNEKGGNKVWAIGVLKLKYVLQDQKTDTLFLELKDNSGKQIKILETKYAVSRGDNRIEIDFMKHPKLKHLQYYNLFIKTKSNNFYKVIFRFVNTDFIN